MSDIQGKIERIFSRVAVVIGFIACCLQYVEENPAFEQSHQDIANAYKPLFLKLLMFCAYTCIGFIIDNGVFGLLGP